MNDARINIYNVNKCIEESFVGGKSTDYLADNTLLAK